MIRLSEVERRARAATPGNWRAHWDYKGKTADSTVAAFGPGHRVVTDAGGGLFTSADMEFTGHARTDVPALAAALRVAVEGLEAVRENYPEHTSANVSTCAHPVCAALARIAETVEVSS